MKKKYESPLAEVQEFDLKDILMIVNSGNDAELNIEEEAAEENNDLDS